MIRNNRLGALLTALLAFSVFSASYGAVAHAQSSQASNSTKAPAFNPDADQGGTDVRPQDVFTWQPFQAVEQADGAVQVQIGLTANQDWKIYASNLKLAGPPGFTIDQMTPPKSRKFLDPISNKQVDVYEGGEFALHFIGAARWTDATFPVRATYVGCTNVICLFPYTESIAVPFLPYKAPLTAASVATPPGTLTPPAASAVAASPAKDAQVAATSGSPDLETRLANALHGHGLSLWLLALIVFAGGLVSNLTPCVAPMIPITLRLLARQGHSPYTSAFFYALGIVVTYTALGLVAALSGGLFGSLLASKTFNVVFALIMIGLGLTMLGFGDLSKIQMLGSRLGSGKPSAGNTFLMGAGAGLVAAPCTGPILAALLAFVAQSSAGVGVSAGLMFAYSVGFALPYMALGGAAAKVSSVKVSPRIQVAVKLVFAAVMFGLGLYYLRIPLYTLAEQLRGHWQPVATAGLIAGAALTLLWLAKPSLQASKAAMIVPTAILGLGLFAGFEWATSAGPVDARALTWYHTESEALPVSEASGKPVLIDMWAEWCEACKKMDSTTFADPRVIRELAQNWVLIRLDLTESNDVNDAVQQKYSVQSLPTLVMLPPSGELTGKRQITGYTNAAELANMLHQYSTQKGAE